MKKIGHMGTLDPDACGVLPVGVGQATRLTEYYSAQDKTYLATLILGVSTNTQDASGQVLTSRNVDLSPGELAQALEHFCGDIWQIPPMYSAVHHEGRRLYELARSGVVVERAPRLVRINGLRMLRWREGEHPQADLEVICSKGTYIRTLCHDIGAYIGCGGHMAELWRTRVGPWTLQEAWTLEDVARDAERGDYGFLQEMGWGLPLPITHIDPWRIRGFTQGLATMCQASQFDSNQVDAHEECVVQVRCQGVFLGIGKWRHDSLYPVKVMADAYSLHDEDEEGQ